MKIKLKRLTSLMLAVLMVCGMFPMPSFAAGSTVNMTPSSVIYDANGNKVQETSNKNAALSDGQVILTKHAEATNTPNQYMITLTVRGKGIQSTVQGADIVLVMDKSGSMKTEGMTALKNAAETF
ncbi:MAG: VWA domain-containing protein, partial [Clostridia bacterium]|nr:VWA domain-containing protein [Clostridia bacterium]